MAKDLTPFQWSKMSPAEQGQCVETTSALNKQGYGRTTTRRFGVTITTTHRLAWIDDRGSLPPADKPCILHHCDNPSCKNPLHLFAGIRADNNSDRDAKGRHWQRSKLVCPTCSSEYSLTSGNRRVCKSCKSRGNKANYQLRRALGKDAVCPHKLGQKDPADA